jgi:ribosome-binding protein aMBF1 (putative translation factor)
MGDEKVRRRNFEAEEEPDEEEEDDEEQSDDRNIIRAFVAAAAGARARAAAAGASGASAGASGASASGAAAAASGALAALAGLGLGPPPPGAGAPSGAAAGGAPGADEVPSVLHPHPLTFLIPYDDNGFGCNGCKEDFQSGVKSYHCEDCNFDLCEACFASLENRVKQEAKLPSAEAKLPLHPHPLKFMVPYHQMGYSCDICGDDAVGSIRSWHCPECRYDVCKKCYEENKPPGAPDPENMMAMGDAPAAPAPAAPPAAPLPAVPADHKFEALKFFRRYCKACLQNRADHAISRENLFKETKLEEMNPEQLERLWAVYDLDRANILDRQLFKLLVTDYYQAIEERIPAHLREILKGEPEPEIETQLKAAQDHFKKVPVDGIAGEVVRELDPQQSGGVKKETFLSSLKQVMARWDPFKE